MKKYKLKNEIMNESELQRIYEYPMYPRDSKNSSEKCFVNIDKGSVGGSHWTCFIVKDKKSYYFDIFGGLPDKFLLNQITKPIMYHNFKLRDKNSLLCGSNCLHFFYLIERRSYYDTIPKLVFEYDYI